MVFAFLSSGATWVKARRLCLVAQRVWLSMVASKTTNARLVAAKAR
jgi:hypothetical protein